ncbi:hypothetical protein [Mycoplasma sp. P36-A1]|uniref:hypothetical protein n=1 Tax=Mycoplasma sp. P36-A1 TaxID=3252900 RepID=UPI003C2AF8A3
MLKYKEAMLYGIIISLISLLFYMLKAHFSFINVYNNYFITLILIVFVFFLCKDNIDHNLIIYRFKRKIDYYIFMYREKITLVAFFLFVITVGNIFFALLNSEYEIIPLLIFASIVFLTNISLLLFYYYISLNIKLGKYLYFLLLIIFIATRFFTNLKISLFNYSDYNNLKYNLLITILCFILGLTILYFNNKKIKIKKHTILMCIVTIVFFIIRYRIYEGNNITSFENIVDILFYNSAAVNKYETVENLFFTHIYYVLFFIIILYYLINQNNSNSDLLKFSIHKQQLKANIRQMYVMNFINSFILIFAMFVIHLLVYHYVTNLPVTFNDVSMFYYYFKLILAFSLITNIINLAIIFNKYIHTIYINIVLIILLTYTDITIGTSILLKSSVAIYDFVYILIFIALHVLIYIIFMTIYKRKRDIFW